MESDDFTRHYIIRYLSARELVLPPPPVLCPVQLESVVSFLSQVPDPQGQPALNFVMTQWCTRHVSQ